MKRKRIENWNIILQLILSAIFGAVMLTGCTDDAFESNKRKPVDQTGVPEGFVRAHVNMIASGFETVQTKSLTSQQEHNWTHVVVGQFDANNELIDASVKQYVPDESGNFNVILANSGGANNLIYFITNYGEANGDMGMSGNNPFINPATGTLVVNLDEFKTLVYTPDSTDNASISSGDKLVMVGFINMEVSLEETPISSILVYVDKLTAKLDVMIEASQSISSPSHPFIGATLSITGLQIVNVPKHAAFATDGDKITVPENLSSIKAGLTDNGGDLVKNYSTSESYYILENRMHGDDEALYPNNASERGKEQFKNNAAADNEIDNLATYLLVEGVMNDGRNVGKVAWKIYLGENNIDNFNIKRNTHYTVTVKIDGAGIVTSDIRVDKENLHVRELRYLNGRYASNRSPETSYLDPNDTNWGNQVRPVPVANTNSYLYMDAGEDTWGFELVDIYGNVITNWQGLSLSYLPLKDGASDPGTNANMGIGEIRSKWVEDDEANWINVGVKKNGLPSGARIRINVGVNVMPVPRTVELRYFNDNEPDMNRAWRVTQYATDKITILDNNFFPSEAGTYGVMVRAKEGSYWRLQEITDAGPVFEGVIDLDGDKVQNTVGDGYISGHGTILFKVTRFDGVANKRKRIVVRTFDGNPNGEIQPGYADKTVYINQMASAENLIKTKALASGRYVYDYTTDPLYETMFAFEGSLPMGINLVDEGTDYDKDESKYGATSTSDGKENTLKIFKALEGYVAEQINYAAQGMTAPPVFSPAGFCMMMNEEWWDINSADDLRLEWYLPARYHGLMGATTVMLGVKGIALNSRGHYWTSTVPKTTPSSVRNSAYFAGTTVDVSANYSSTGIVRCVRDNKNVEKTYPYLTNISGNPVIVSYEKVNGVEKGYVDVNPMTTGTYSYYRLGLPLRFTEKDQVSDVSGEGPADPNWSYLSPRFRVAKKDAVIANSLSNGTWVEASGWSNSNAVDLATPLTGCAAYSEEGSESGWRLPSELEMRQILLLGGGVGSKSGSPAQIPELQKGGMTFNDFTDLGFDHLGGSQTNGRYYWVNRKYPNDNRAVYFNVTNRWDNAISGSAMDWNTSSVYVRCVRDM